MSAAIVLDPSRPVLDQLRDRVTALQGGPVRQPVPTHPVLAGLLQLRTGGAYAVDSAALALALAGEPSRHGEWVALVGWSDLGAEAGSALGLDLSRTVVVPDPGEHWLEVTAALVDVVRVVVLRPPARVDARAAGVVEARLRKRGAVLVVWGDWPRAEARLSVERSAWAGPDGGHGRLRARRARLAVRRGETPPVHADVWLPGEHAALEAASPIEQATGGTVQRLAASR